MHTVFMLSFALRKTHWMPIFYRNRGKLCRSNCIEKFIEFSERVIKKQKHRTKSNGMISQSRAVFKLEIENN